MKVRLAAPIQTDSIVDGEGLRTVIWMQGCSHNCLACHNPETHDFNGGQEVDIEQIFKELSLVENQTGITLSGGDPMSQPEASLFIAGFAHQIGLNVWCYTGFTFEELLTLSKTKPIYLELLKNIDVLIDGRFELEHKSLNCIYRGSTNQRIIDVTESLKKNKVMPKKEYYCEIEEKEKAHVFI